MIRAATFLLLFVPLGSTAQTTEVIDRALLRQAICGTVGIQAQMLDTSHDRPRVSHQKVGLTLKNLKSTPIVLERLTLHFGGETPTSGAPFEWEARVPVGAKQEANFVELTTVPNPVSYVELNSVTYSDGSSWQPEDGEVCGTMPDPLKK